VPGARGAGLGRSLLAAACAEAARRGLHPVLDVVDANRSAVRLYERLGWVPLGSYEETFGDGGPPEVLHCFAAPGATAR
jgi:ribosomal protein S18 acetylase RimI-like enzyme